MYAGRVCRVKPAGALPRTLPGRCPGPPGAHVLGFEACSRRPGESLCPETCRKSLDGLRRNDERRTLWLM